MPITASQVAHRVTDRLPPHSYFVGSAIFHYLGPAFAVLLFAAIDPLGVAWLRIAAAAVVLALWRRPWRLVAQRRLTPTALRLLIIWGAVFALMNACFYLALERLPLGTVAAIEFVPVIVLAAVAVRRLRNAIALVLAIAGVYLLTDVHLYAEPLGLLFAAANAVLFAGYIVVGHRIASSGAAAGVDSLAFAMPIAAVVSTPIAIFDAVPAFSSPTLLAAGVGVGVCSSVIPYVFDQLAMARLTRETYALLVSILPATATVIGVIVLAQIPTLRELSGVAMVIAAVGIHRDRVAAADPGPDE